MLLSSPRGYALLERNEGRVLHVYPDSAGYHTIGVGHLLTATEKASGKLRIGNATVAWVKGLTNAQATALLHQDTGYAERGVTQLVHMPLLQNQFDALVSFVYNVGVPRFAGSTLLRVLNQGKYDAVPTQMLRWELAGGKHDPGLVVRREREVALWRGL